VSDGLILRFRAVDSTNDPAAQPVERGARAGTAAVARDHASGAGRRQHNIHVGAFRDAELVAHGDISNDRDRTPMSSESC